MGTEWEHEASSRALALVSDRNHGSDALPRLGELLGLVTEGGEFHCLPCVERRGVKNS